MSRVLTVVAVLGVLLGVAGLAARNGAAGLLAGFAIAVVLVAVGQEPDEAGPCSGCGGSHEVESEALA